MNSQDEMFNAKEYLIVLGQNVRMMREKRKLSIAKLAELSYYDRICLAKLERGEQNIKLVTVVKLARVLNVSFPSLFSRNFETMISGIEYEGVNGFHEDDYLMIFIENFKRKQISLRQTQMKVLILTGVDEVTVSNIIHKKNINPTIKTLSAMAFTVKTDMLELFIRSN